MKVEHLWRVLIETGEQEEEEKHLDLVKIIKSEGILQILFN